MIKCAHCTDVEAIIEVVLRPEGVGRVVGGIDDALHIK